MGELDPTSPPGIKAAEVAAETAYNDCVSSGKTKTECDTVSANAYEAELKK